MIPKFPDDFRVLHADGGVGYWHWHPDAPDDYDGTWPADQDPPPWAGGLMISSEGSVQPELVHDELVLVVWEFGPELESGPFDLATPDPIDVQRSIERVLEMVAEERKCAGTSVGR